MIKINTEPDRAAYLSRVLNDTKYTAHTVKEKVPTTDTAATLEISEEGMRKIQSEEYHKEYTEEEIRHYDPFETKELEDELYMSMLRRSGEQLKDKEHNYNASDLMKAMMDAYAQEYDRIIKDHEDGDRQVNYEISGKWSITLDEELGKLEEAFQRRLDNLDVFIGIKQLNEKMKLTPIDWELLKRLYEKNAIPFKPKPHKIKTIDPKDRDSLEHSYNETAVSMMKEAQKVFLERYRSGNNYKGMASSIVSGLMSSDSDFMRKTHALYG